MTSSAGRDDAAQARLEMDRYRSWIERDGTFWEVIDDETGERYSSTLLTHSDEGMLWSAIFLDLLENPDQPPAIMRVSPPPDSVPESQVVPVL